jgi:lipopolysaccharide/colanic/teichoic acid biosynthesis glycosyltransferase
MELKFIELVSSDFLYPDGGIPSWKRVLDSVVIVAALPVILPVMLLIALYIKLVSPGPVFFRQERIGYYGQPFTIYKFRTMHANAPTVGHEKLLEDLISNSSKPMTKMDEKGDSRIIRGGGVLRAGLDELPQLINVLRGEMSLVGPRPCTPTEYGHYSPWHSRRLETLPGLTGLWQVSGKNKLSFEQMVQLDIHYAEHSSVWLDLQIMLRTFPVLFSQAMEVVSRRLRARPEPEMAVVSRLDEVPAHRRHATRSGRRLFFRNHKDKECQTRLTLESSVVDTGDRT